MSVLELLKLEYYKFKNSTVVLFLLAFFTALTPFAILMGRKMFKGLPPPFPNVETFYQFPSVWEYQGYLGSWFIFFFLGYVSVYMVTSDVSSKTMRQNIITGMTRTEYFLAKVVSITTFSIYATLLYTISSIALGIINTKGWDISMIFDNNWAILRYFLMSMGYMSFGLFTGFIIRKGGLAVAVYFLSVMIIDFLLKGATLYVLGKLNLDEYRNIANYWPLNVFEDLHPNPIIHLSQKMILLAQDLGNNYEILVPKDNAMIASAIYIALLLGIAYRIFLKKDL